MKVVLDLDRLLAEGKITPAEHQKFSQFAAQGAGSMGVNVLVGFAVVAIAAGAIALVPSPNTGFLVGGGLFALGLALTFTQAQHWQLLAQICVVIGALMAAGGVIAIGLGSLQSLLIATAALAVASIVARSSLLMAAAVLALAACLGARTGYRHATYSLAIYEPLLTIVLFSLLALGAYLLSKRLKPDYETVAITAARTSIVLINFGFWIGSLWGDRLTLLRSLSDPSATAPARWGEAIVPTWMFSAGWAIALIAVGLWGLQANRRWVVNVAAVFGAIHFYTQWFWHLGANPLAVLLGGILMLGLALGLWRFNRTLWKTA